MCNLSGGDVIAVYDVIVSVDSDAFTGRYTLRGEHRGRHQ